MTRFVCVHGHFYQPPRENPWLDFVELQDSAYPYHDWNERITYECYRPNTAAHILDAEGLLEQAVDTYARISFNLGPTLLSWLQQQAPETYRRILGSDRDSRARFSGHGSAIAQAYNHLIMPLANPRDQATQVRWGIADFEYRYGRSPEGMWLPETAVDTPTLEALAEHGIRFTVLAPHQAALFRPLHGDGGWQAVTGTAPIDTTRAYLQRLPSGRSIALFFYNGPLSQEVAFSDILQSGHRLAERLTGAFDPERERPQLVHIATDGETYGHHHRFGDMALAYALRQIEQTEDVQLTNYGEFLERFPPEHEVQIAERTSWSCAHGVGRWSEDCGCNMGQYPGGNQAWRAPLRAALDWLRDDLAPLYEREAAPLLSNPWAARDAYIRVILERTDGRRNAFLAEHATHELSHDERVRVWKLLELQRNSLLMYTSCGWFFDDVSGIEASQVLLYAARAAELARELDGVDREGELQARLSSAPSNAAQFSDAGAVYRAAVGTARVTFERAAGNAALQEIARLDVGRRELALRADPAWAHDGVLHADTLPVYSTLTEESWQVPLLAVNTGDGPIVGLWPRQEGWAERASQALAEYGRAPDRAWLEGEFWKVYGIEGLLHDSALNVLDQLLEAPRQRLAARIETLYPNLLRFASEDVPPPPAPLRDLGAEVAALLRPRLIEAIERADTLTGVARRLLTTANAWHLPMDHGALSYRLTLTLDALTEAWAADPHSRDALGRLSAALSLATGPHPLLHANLWLPQTVCHQVIATHPEAFGSDHPSHAGHDPGFGSPSPPREGLADGRGSAVAAPDGDWVARVRQMAGMLRVRLPAGGSGQATAL